MENLPDYSVQEETRQMQKLQMYQKLVIYTLLKFKWSILLIFAAVLLLGAVVRYVQFSRSPFKHEASITLFYTPRASEEVKTLSINHVLGIFSRQQVYRQLIDELHLNDKQQAILKQSIEDFEIKVQRNDGEAVKLHASMIKNLEKRLEELQAKELAQWDMQADPDPAKRMPAEIFQQLNAKLLQDKEFVRQVEEKINQGGDN